MNARNLYLALILAITCALRAGASDRPEIRGTAENYVLRADDLIEIKVYQEDDLTTRVRIPSDGQIALPLVGPVRVSSKTVREAEEMIRKALAQRFLVHPNVNLAVLEYARTYFTVVGQVQRAGTYKFPDRSALNLVQAIGIAGGYTRIADTTRIILKRRANGKEIVLKLDAKRMAREDSTKTVAIEPGDIITVAERMF